ncbi:hypothetical protein TNCT_545001 [Trichonephila clavata]|uniref:C2H2-type domain-containing protein n=1 Tax=Trichonephila clavata TaxID=2740835 RepID=A0A8X6HM89_TRICU|nr:hypothetical protein TNCT_545001 [Trichonephila clavata]
MAECLQSTSEEEWFYFCISCANIHREPVFILIVSRYSFLTCIECQETFKTGYKTKKRTPAHFCIDCKEIFPTPLLLKLHSEEHSGDLPYKCSTCLKVFAVYSAWEWHRKQRDTIQKIDCRKCWRSFKGKVCPGVLCDLNKKHQVHCAVCCIGSNGIEYVTA